MPVVIYSHRPDYGQTANRERGDNSNHRAQRPRSLPRKLVLQPFPRLTMIRLHCHQSDCRPRTSVPQLPATVSVRSESRQKSINLDSMLHSAVGTAMESTAMIVFARTPSCLPVAAAAGPIAPPVRPSRNSAFRPCSTASSIAAATSANIAAPASTCRFARSCAPSTVFIPNTTPRLTIWRWSRNGGSRERWRSIAGRSNCWRPAASIAPSGRANRNSASGASIRASARVKAARVCRR